MDRAPLAHRTAPVDVLARLIGADPDGIAVWAGKAAKSDRRTFVHLASRDGEYWFAKICDDDKPGSLGAEYEAIRHVQAMLAGTPYYDACSQRTEYRQGVLVQKWRAGISHHAILISSRYRFWRRGAIARDCTAVTDWLAGFHALGATERATRTVATIGATHGDFKPANILRTGKTGIAVVDWELFDRRGVQLHDLFHFLLYSGMTLTAPDRMRGLRLTFFEPSWISRIARMCLWRYLAGSRCTAASVSGAFEHYIEATLDRRAALGLSNTKYFMVEARKLTAELRRTPYAFEPLEQGLVT